MPQVDITLPNGVSFTLRVHERDDMFISEEIVRTGQWEPLETEVLSRLLARDVDFYDIGANIGWYTLLAAKRLDGRGTVHAFEPVAENVTLLARNIAMNGVGNVRVSPCAVGAATGSARMYLSTVNKGDHRAYELEEAREVQAVGMIRLDDYIGRAPRRAVVIKADTQGFEHQVLIGMGNFFLSHPEEMALVIEFWPYGLAQNRARVGDLLELIDRAGFAAAVLAEPGDRLHKTCWKDLAAAAETTIAPSTNGFVNLFLYRENSRFEAAVRDLLSDEPSRLAPRVS